MSNEVDIAVLKSELSALKKDYEALEKKVDDLQSFKRWVMGIGTAVGVTAGFFARQITDALSGVLGHK